MPTPLPPVLQPHKSPPLPPLSPWLNLNHCFEKGFLAVKKVNHENKLKNCCIIMNIVNFTKNLFLGQKHKFDEFVKNSNGPIPEFLDTVLIPLKLSRFYLIMVQNWCNLIFALNCFLRLALTMKRKHLQQKLISLHLNDPVWRKGLLVKWCFYITL